jgi:hypothetical protein
MPITLNGDTGITTPTYGGTDTSEYLVPVTAFKNRIINGAMQIDQRNAGASVTPANATVTYTLDRWFAFEDTDGACSVQQITDAPTGFVNSLRFTTTTADSSLSASQRVFLAQRIEGFNVSDLAWGTASAATVTLSFWVKSTLTGTFGGALQNSAFNRAYPFTYTILAANTWEQKTVTIAGDTTGTWSTNSSLGIQVAFGLGVGTDGSGTAGSWAASNLQTAIGATSVIGTLNATWQVTGVQLEKGSTATSFDYRPFTNELALCQRYYQKSFPQATAPAQNAGTTGCAFAQSSAPSGSATAWVNFPVVMRATPSTVTFFNPSAANGNWRNLNTNTDVNSQLYSSSQASIYIIPNTQTIGQYQIVAIHYIVDAEL